MRDSKGNKNFNCMNITSPPRHFQIGKLTLPIFIEFFLQMLVSNVDQFMVGHYSLDGVAAIGNANQIMNVLLLTFGVISCATIILITNCIGAGDRRKVELYHNLAMAVNLVFSVGVGLVLLFGSRTIYKMMHVPDEIMSQTMNYTIIVGSFIVFQAATITYSAIFRSHAMMKEGMIISIIMNIVNIIGNAILIPHLGVSGAAIATVASRAVSTGIGTLFFYKKLHSRFRFRLLWPFPYRELWNFLMIGVPTAGEMLSYNISQLAMMTFINMMGAVAITTKVFCSMFAMLAYLFCISIGQASQVIVGYLYGAKKYNAAEARTWKTTRISMIVTLTVSILLLIFAGPLLRLFGATEEIVSLGRWIMLVDLFLEQGRVLNVVLVRTLQTVGDIRFPTAICIFDTWLISVSVGYFLAFPCHMGLIGIWIAMALDEITRGIIFYYRFKCGGWRKRNFLAIT